MTAGDERSLLPDRYSGLDYNTQSVWYRWDSKIPSEIFNVFYRNRKISSIVISQAKAFPAHGKGMTVLGPKGWAFGCSTQKGIIVGVKHMTYEYIVEHDRWINLASTKKRRTASSSCEVNGSHAIVLGGTGKSRGKTVEILDFQAPYDPSFAQGMAHVIFRPFRHMFNDRKINNKLKSGN